MEVDEDFDEGNSGVGRDLASNGGNEGSEGQDQCGDCSHSVTEATVLEKDSEVEDIQEEEGHKDGD